MKKLKLMVLRLKGLKLKSLFKNRNTTLNEEEERRIRELYDDYMRLP